MKERTYLFLAVGAIAVIGFISSRFQAEPAVAQVEYEDILVNDGAQGFHRADSTFQWTIVSESVINASSQDVWNVLTDLRVMVVGIHFLWKGMG